MLEIENCGLSAKEGRDCLHSSLHLFPQRLALAAKTKTAKPSPAAKKTWTCQDMARAQAKLWYKEGMVGKPRRQCAFYVCVCVVLGWTPKMAKPAVFRLASLEHFTTKKWILQKRHTLICFGSASWVDWTQVAHKYSPKTREEGV